MRTSTLFRLFTGSCLTWLLTQSATAQGYDPALADPTYEARKQLLITPHATPAPPAPTASALQPKGGTLLPARTAACFEPLDSVSAPTAGGYTPLARGDDNSSAEIPLGFSFTLFGTQYTSAYINTNGNISFGAAVTAYSASGFPIATPMVAGFWADVDTRPAGSGRVWYKLYADRLVVTWNRVGYYDSNTTKKNTFQIVIRANSANVLTDDVIFAYGDMQWTTGSASGGTNGFGGTLATVGANRGVNNEYIQTGRFNLNDATHPDNVSASGVNWLDNQCLSYRVFRSGNLPPVASNFPTNSTITVNQGQTVSIAPQFSGPEPGQTVSLAVNTNGLCNTSYSVSTGINPTLNLSVTGASCNIGTSTITITATDNGSPVATQSFPLTVVVNPPFVWTGSTSTDFANAANWSNNLVPSSSANVSIPAGAVRMPILSTTASANDVTVAVGASLTLAGGGALTLNGALQANGSLSGPGTLLTGGSTSQLLGGTSAIAIGSLTVGSAGASLGNTLSISQALTLTGTLTTNGNTLTLLSTLRNDALVVNNGGIVAGTATVQRAIDPSLNSGLGYRHYSAPISNATVASLTSGGATVVVNSAYNTAAAPTTTRPFPTVYGYDQSRLTLTNNLGAFDKGWFSPAAPSDPLAVGQGYTANVGASQVVNFVGTLNNGPITLNLNRNSDATANDAGWQLLGNPYPAPLDFSLVSAADRPNVDGAIYVYSSTSQYGGQYRAYTNRVGGNPVIPMGQGFFARVSTGQPSGSLTFRNSQRLTSATSTTFQRTTAETRPLVQLTLRGSGNASDAVYVYFQAGATTGVDGEYDALKLPNTTGLNLAAQASATALAINGLPDLTANVTVPLSVQVPATGTYVLTTDQLLNLPAGCQAFLVDASTGTRLPLAAQSTYSFSTTTAATGPRFSLLFSFSQALATTTNATAEQVLLYPNPAQEVVLLQLPTTLRSTLGEARLFNALGQVVRSYRLPANTSAPHELPLRNLAPGVYTLQVTTAGASATKRLTVE